MDAAAPRRPTLSVVVTIVEAGPALGRCLAALEAQDGIPGLEILVPYDASLRDAAALAAAQFPGCRFLDLGTLPTARPPHSAAGQHELYDRRRAAGLAAASGSLIAILEDRGAPAPDWGRNFARLHHSLDYAVIGGAVEWEAVSLLAHAVFLCDFARYRPPFAAGVRDYLTDINVCYKREALERTRTLWQERFHETTVHWALQRDGLRLFLSPQPVIHLRRTQTGVVALLRERFAWGRLFAATRAREATLAARLALAAACAFLPVLLWARILLLAMGRRRLHRLGWATPALLGLLAAWAAGEAAGYVTGRD